MEPAIIVHGGAGAIPDDLAEGHQEGCRRAARAGLELLRQGASAEDAVELAVRLMEDDPVFDAGRGSHLNADGMVELDAAMMEGAGLNLGAVAAVRDIANPITLARQVMASPHCLLVGEGASRFADGFGLPRCSPESLVIAREWELLHEHEAELRAVKGVSDTVGAICLDRHGHLVAGVSTGGTRFKWPGRVGDVPCPGCGYYADDRFGAAVSTGHGEAIMRIIMARHALVLLESGLSPQQVVQKTIAYLWQRVRGEAGLILLDREGRPACAFNTPRMGRAWNVGDEIVAYVEPEG